MNDGMPCDPIQGHEQSHGASELLKFRKLHFSMFVSSTAHLQWELANDH